MDNLNDPKREKYRFCRGCLTSSDNMKPIDSYRENFNLLTGVKVVDWINVSQIKYIYS